MTKKTINIIELDSRDVAYQTGIQRYFDVLAQHMPENVKTFKIIFYRQPSNSEVTIRQTDDELQVFHPVGFPAPSLYEAVIAFIGNKLGAMENLIIKSNCLSLEQLTYAIKGRFYCKTMGVLHCLPHRSGPVPAFPPVNPFGNMDHVVVVCDTGKEFLEGVKNKRPFSVIPNGIDKPVIKSKKKDDGVFRFIFANGWAPHKGLIKIIPAIKQVAEKHKIEVIVLGGQRAEDKIPEDIDQLPIVRTGLINDPEEINKYYEMADAALFASGSEACSFAGIEAMAYNLPIVSTDAAGLVEMFNKAALFVQMDEKKDFNPDNYAQQMIRLIENKKLRSKLSILAYARYLERYTAKKMAKDTINLYEQILK